MCAMDDETYNCTQIPDYPESSKTFPVLMFLKEEESQSDSKQFDLMAFRFIGVKVKQP